MTAENHAAAVHAARIAHEAREEADARAREKVRAMRAAHAAQVEAAAKASAKFNADRVEAANAKLAVATAAIADALGNEPALLARVMSDLGVVRLRLEKHVAHASTAPGW